METHHFDTGFGKAPKIFFRVDYHQVGVHRLDGFLGNRFYNRKAIRNVRHKHAVHDIQMENIRTAVHHLDIFFQMQKVS